MSTIFPKALLPIIGAIVLCSTRLFALGITGSIEGRILELSSHRPVIGANVIIVGTTIGTVSDTAGRYRFPNVRAGSYDLRFSGVGYKSVFVRGVSVEIDLRTHIDVTMELSAVEMEEVEVVAQTPLIQTDLAATAYTVTSGKFTALPVSTFQEVLSLQPGVTLDGHVRGGKTNEGEYLVDGLPVQDVFSGNAGTNLPRESISSMTMSTGGFSAQYGNAMSGIVNIVTRSGSNTHQFLARAEVDNVLPANFNQQRDNLKELELSANGPIITDNLFYYTANTVTLTDTRWRQDFQYFFPSPVSQEFSGIGKVDYLLTPATRLSGQFIYSIRDSRDYEYSWRYNLAGLPELKRNSYRAAATLSHTSSDKTFYTLSLSDFFVHNRIGEAYDIDTLRPWQYDLFYRFVQAGDRFWHGDHRQNILTLKGDFSTFYGDAQTISGGIEFNQYTIASVLERFDPPLTYFGKPIEGKPLLAYYNDYRYLPRSGGVFLQDKIEFKSDGSTLNLGIRWDFLDPAVSQPLVAYGPSVHDTVTASIIGSKKASLKNQFSPRVALSMPISLTSILYLNYGLYYQYPLFDYLYSGLTPAQIKTGTVPVLAGNPNLDPEETLSWEIGYKQAFRKQWLASLVYFQKTVRNQIDSKTLVPSDSKIAGDFGYASYVNSAQANISGVEVLLVKEGEGRVTGSVSYTYMITEGTSDYVNQAINYAQWGFPLAASPYPLSWDQRHTVKADLAALLFWDIRANATMTFATGRPYSFYPTTDGFTPADTSVQFVPNNKRMDQTLVVNAKFIRKFVLDEQSHSTLSVYVDVRNLMNKKNVLWVDSNGQVGGELSDPSAYSDPRRARVGINVEF